MAVVRNDLDRDLHRLSNYLECQLGDILQTLMVEGRSEAVTDVAWSGSRLIQTLRQVRDGQEGGEA